MSGAREIPSASSQKSQPAAGILPADQSEQSTAGKMPAAPWRCRLTSSRFMVTMHAKERKGLSMNRPTPGPLSPSADRPFD